MFSIDSLTGNPDYIIVEVIKPELYGLRCWYQHNLIFDRARFNCPKECSKKIKREFVALLEAKILELGLNF